MKNFSALYLSLKRMGEVVGLPSVPLVEPSLGIAELPTGALLQARVVNSVERRVLDWLRTDRIATLGQLALEDKLAPGTFFSHYGLTLTRGLSRAIKQFRSGEAVSPMPIMRIGLADLCPGLEVNLPIHPANLTSHSAGFHLQGSKRELVVARVIGQEQNRYEAQAYAIGFLHDELFEPSLPGDPLHALENHMEVFATQIDAFKSAARINTPTARELGRLEDISEVAIKEAFATILGEPFVPKDWGGERSDLTTSQLTIEGSRMVAAFAFKGPARFGPMTVAHLGKNGDQIFRLFSEPADIVVLQHCHEITQPVRAHMRAFATSIHNPRPFCLIDGAETVRILKANNVLGYKSRVR